MAAERLYDYPAILAAFEKYVAETDIPIVVEFAAQQGIYRTLLYDVPDFKDVLDRCLAKKESALERLGLTGAVNTTMAIFSLKQLGWSDRQDITHKGDAAHPLVISPTDAKL